MQSVRFLSASFDSMSLVFAEETLLVNVTKCLVNGLYDNKNKCTLCSIFKTSTPLSKTFCKQLFALISSRAYSRKKGHACDFSEKVQKKSIKGQNIWKFGQKCAQFENMLEKSSLTRATITRTKQLEYALRCFKFWFLTFSCKVLSLYLSQEILLFLYKVQFLEKDRTCQGLMQK